MNEIISAGNSLLTFAYAARCKIERGRFCDNAIIITNVVGVKSTSVAGGWDTVVAAGGGEGGGWAVCVSTSVEC